MLSARDALSIVNPPEVIPISGRTLEDNPMLALTKKAAHAANAVAPRSISRYVSWTLQVLAAAILAQTLFFKFSGAEEARHIFSTLGVEPWGRLATGAFEALAVVLLLVPRTVVFGAALSMGLMVGAIGSHLGPLGIEVLDDGGLLFALAIVVFGASAGILWLRRAQAFAWLSVIRAKEGRALNAR